MTDDKLAARIAKVGDRVSRIVAVASPSPDLFRANEGAYAALAVLLATHECKPYYLGASDCEHPEPPEDTSDWADWDGDHPPGTGDVGRICLLTQIASYCPECTRLVHGDEEPSGEEYVPAPCGVRAPIASALPGEANTGG